MAVHTIKRYVRPYEQVKENLLERARKAGNPFDACEYAVVEQTLDRLTSVHRDHWAETWSAVARPYELEARTAEARGDLAAAQASYRRAYGYYRVGRYTTTNSEGKREAYRHSAEMFLKWASHLDPPARRVEIPFPGRPAEGSVIPAYLRVPASPRPAPIVVQWGGIDGFKEDRRDDSVLALGLASLSMDMPGVGDSPLKGSEDAERLFPPVFDWIATQPDLDPSRIALWGRSTGGYWAAKAAHVYPDRIRGAVDHGGCTHFAFTPEWIERSQDGEYPFELAETLAYSFGLSSFEEWVENAPRFSLLTQGILEQPCAPLLLINGIHDSTFPIQDMHLLLEHGGPKRARLYDSNHMGHTPRTEGDILAFLSEVLQ